MEETVRYGKLYIVATPIGNHHDMSPRGIEILSSVDLIAAEDTRRTIILMNKLGIHNELISNHNYNEMGRCRGLIERLKNGESIAVVTDAGTPCVSDPGNVLVKAAVSEGIEVLGIPGCCAAINSLVVSGFDLSSFTFMGFFPRDNGERMRHLKRMRKDAQIRTYVYYESPKRIMSVIDFMIENGMKCRLCLSNDMTKKYEMHFRGTPEEVKQQLLDKGNYEKGEFVLSLEIDKDYIITQQEHISTPEAVLADMMVQKECSVKEAIKYILADETNTYSKNELYDAGLSLKSMFGR